jgi:MFS family permease
VPLQEHLSLPPSQYTYLPSALYTAYAIPNTFLPLFSGLAVERLGEKRVLVVTLASVIVGQLIFALAIQFQFMFRMILGRVLIGLGAEIIGVLGSEITTRWFK